MTKPKRFITVITNEKGKFSLHSSWKTACESYGWDYTPSIPKSNGDYKIKKMPFDVTINCLELVEFIGRKNVSQEYSKYEGDYVFSIIGYNKEYRVTCDWKEKHEPADYHFGDRGRETISEAYDYVELTRVIKVELLNDESEVEIVTDNWTNEQILNFLEINEIL